MVQGKSLNIKETGLKKISGYIITLAAPVIMFFLLQCCVQFPATGIQEENAFFSCIWMEALSLTLILFSGSIKIPLAALSLFFLLLGTAEHYVYRFRASFLTPIDFFSAGTAFNVAANYDFTPDPALIFVFVSFIILTALIIFLCPSGRDVKFFANTSLRLTYACIFLISLVGMTQYIRHYDRYENKALDISDNAFHSYRNNRREGVIIRLLYDSGYIFVREPEGYSASREEEILKEYGEKAAGAVPAKEELPDIVVVMNESFSDPSLVGPIETNTDYMPFVHSLQEGRENTVTGVINVSVQGGNTPNTEFEFLTGCSMAFLPRGSIPFQQYLTHDIPAMPRYLSSMGYETVAMHPYLSNGWNRTRAYPYLGFSDMKFLEYFEEMDPEYVREYISDKFFLSAIRDEVDRRNDDGPVFSFNVTMQNHSSYSKDYDNLKRDIRILSDEDTPYLHEMENYLNLVKLSDDAFREMVEYYEGSDRKTLLVFFGDHQPPTINYEPVFHNLGTDRRNLSQETEWDIYRVPFVIWANYDIEEESGIETSVNYLGNLVMKKAGIPLYDFRSYLDELSNEVPVVSAVRTVDKNGQSRNTGEEEPDLSEYGRLQYYELFDGKAE